jgi:hypothetical protein
VDYYVTCDGIPIGVASIASLNGLAHAELEPLSGYEAVRGEARAAALRLGAVDLWRAIDGDFAETFAQEWHAGRLALCDATGAELGVASVMVVDWSLPDSAPHPRTIADARPDMSRVEAFLHTLGRDGGDRSRPAA